MSGFTVLRLLTIGLGLLLVGGVIIAVWRDQYGEYGWIFLAGLLGAIFAFVAIFWGAQVQMGITCKNTAAQYGLPYQYSVSTPCLVFDDGRWIDINKVVNNRESSK